MYNEAEVAPLREEAVELGCKELRSAYTAKTEIDSADGVSLVLVNSVCGCAAKMARPGLRLALSVEGKKPQHLFTVFAGQDREATTQVRSYFPGYTPSSPAIGLIKDGKGLTLLERKDIEGRSAEEVAESLHLAFEQYC